MLMMLSMPPMDLSPRDMSLQSLANGLSQICRPASPNSPPAAPHRSPSSPQWSASQLATVHHRKIRVRHQESSRSLQEQLLAICGGRRQDSTLDTLSAMEKEKQRVNEIKSKRPLLRRESYKMAFRLKVDTSDRHYAQLSVVLDKDVLTVQAHGKDSVKALDSDELFSDVVDKETIMCVFNDGEVDVKQYPQKYLKMEYPPGAACYYPIMQEDDVARTWRMCLYVPGCYDAGSIQVKTLDYKLLISWHNTTCGTYKVSMDVPHNVITQSICGGVTEHHTLLLEAQLGTTRDRCLSF